MMNIDKIRNIPRFMAKQDYKSIKYEKGIGFRVLSLIGVAELYTEIRIGSRNAEEI